MDDDELPPGMENYLRWLRPFCTECGSESLSWGMASDLLTETEPPLTGDRLARAKEIVAWASKDAFGWICQSCGELGAVEHGVLGHS